MGLFNKAKQGSKANPVTAPHTDNTHDYKIKGLEAVSISSELSQGDNAFAQAKFYKIILTVILIVQVLSYQTATTLRKTERTIVTPLIGASMTIGSDYVDDAFLINIIGFVNMHYVSATPANAGVQHALLLPLVHPTQYADMQKRLNIRASTLKSLSSTTLYGLVNWGKLFKNNEVINHPYEGVTTKLWSLKFNATRLLLTSNAQPEYSNVDVTLFYTVENGQFWLVDIIEDFR